MAPEMSPILGSGASGRLALRPSMYASITTAPVLGMLGMEAQMSFLLLHKVASMPLGSRTHCSSSSRICISLCAFLKTERPM
eukprot:15809820-Heterocapsa_arctica.AAC.1